MAQKTFVAVTPSALRRRIGRTLAVQGRELRVDRGDRPFRYHVVDTNQQTIVNADVDIEALARELGALRAWETVR